MPASRELNDPGPYSSIAAAVAGSCRALIAPPGVLDFPRGLRVYQFAHIHLSHSHTPLVLVSPHLRRRPLDSSARESIQEGGLRRSHGVHRVEEQLMVMHTARDRIFTTV
jgi:hypothetical protein